MRRNHLLVRTAALAGVAVLGSWLLRPQAQEQPTSRPLTKGELKNEACPISGKPTTAEHLIVYKDDNTNVHGRIYFCCPECPKSVKEADKKGVYEKAFLTKKDGTKIAYGKFRLDLKNKICPISGDNAGESDYVHYNAVRVNMCCPSCSEEFFRDPDKYLHNVNNDIDRALAEAAKEESK